MLNQKENIKIHHEYQQQRQLRTQKDPYTKGFIKLKSIQIVKNQIDTSYYQKLNISIVINDLNDDSRKMIRFISSKYAMNLYDDWDRFWSKQKQLINKPILKKTTSSNLDIDELIIVNEDCVSKLLREMKLNPSMRVILLVKDIKKFQLKEEFCFMLVTDCCKEIQQFLVKIRRRLILTSKS